MIRILIADDDATIRKLLKRLLEAHAGWEVCGEAVNGIEAIQKIIELLPDLAVLDLGMPIMNGVQAATEIRQIRPHLPMLLVTVQQIENPSVPAIREAGFNGAVTKESGAEVVKGVEALLKGEAFFYPPLNESSSNGVSLQT
jgi:DNA-binding NarL/FixJ family response regulator